MYIAMFFVVCDPVMGDNGAMVFIYLRMYIHTLCTVLMDTLRIVMYVYSMYLMNCCQFIVTH